MPFSFSGPGAQASFSYEIIRNGHGSRVELNPLRDPGKKNQAIPGVPSLKGLQPLPIRIDLKKFIKELDKILSAML